MPNAAPTRGIWSGSGEQSSHLTRDQAAAALEVVDNILGLTCCCCVRKAGEGDPLPGEDELLELLLVEWAKGSKAATRTALKLIGEKWPKLSDDDVRKVLKVLDSGLQKGFVASVGADLPGIMEVGYRTAKKGVADKVNAAFLWEAVDKKATAWLGEHHMFWVGDYFNRHVSDGLAEVVQAGMSKGLGRNDIAKEIKGFFDQYPGVTNRPVNYWRGMAANGMNRSRQFGLLGGYENVGVRELEIMAVMDERTSPVCRELNGRIIPVSAGLKQRDKLMAAKNPEDVKDLAPWLSVDQIAGKSTKSVIKKGVAMPPYHFHCRTTVVERF